MNPSPAWHTQLQSYLDGDRSEMPELPDLPGDRESVVRLITGLDCLAATAPPADLTARITASLLEEVREHRRLRRWRFAPAAGLLVAASLLLLLGMRLAWPVPEDSAQRTFTHLDNPTEPLRDSLGRAGTALSSWTTRSAETTVENTSSLLPLVNSQTLPSIPTMPPIDPPLESLREASTGVATGLAPVTDSAQRAVRLFMRDLPFRSTPHKPG